jgi:predicted ATP-dependent serine protease
LGLREELDPTYEHQTGMARRDPSFICQNCGAVYGRWQGKCDAAESAVHIHRHAIVKQNHPLL